MKFLLNFLCHFGERKKIHFIFHLWSSMYGNQILWFQYYSVKSREQKQKNQRILNLNDTKNRAKKKWNTKECGFFLMNHEFYRLIYVWSNCNQIVIFTFLSICIVVKHSKCKILKQTGNIWRIWQTSAGMDKHWRRQTRKKLMNS